MNVLFLSKDYPPNLIGGVGIYTLEMSQLLLKRDNRVYVITSADEFESEYIDRGVRVFRVRPKKFKIFDPIRDKIGGILERLEYSYAVSKKIKEVVHKFDIDIVESCEARMEGFWYFLFNRKPPLVVKLHTPESIVYKLDHVERSLDFKLIELLENWWIERADRVIGLTDAVIDLTEKYFNLNKDHFPKVPNPIDIDFFKPQSSTKLGDEKIVLYVGRLEFRKGVHILIKAMPRVLKQVPDARFIFIGSDCGMKPYILQKIEEFNCSGNVIIKDEISREKLVTYYQNADVCVIPSLWENHPYVCLEAMACGRSVIASRVAGIKELIDNKTRGVLVTPGSYIELARSIVKVLKNKELQEQIGRSARNFIENDYAPDRVLTKTLDIYEEVIRKT